MFVPSRGGPTGVKVTVEELLGGDAAAQRRNKEAEIPAAGLHGVFQPDESRRSGGAGRSRPKTREWGATPTPRPHPPGQKEGLTGWRR